MDILNILSTLQQNNIDIGEVIKNITSIFGTQTYTEPPNLIKQNPNTYYELPQYNIDKEVSPPQPSININNSSNYQNQNSSSIDINKLLELAKTIAPLLSSFKNNAPVQKQTIESKVETKKSEILSLTKI